MRKHDKIPDFPSEIQNKSGKEILSDFELYLNRILETPKLNKSQYFAEFTEFSELINSDVQKYKEGFVLKRAGGRFNESKFLMKCFDCCRCWKRRYLLVTSEGVMYTRGLINERREVRENLLFDHH